MRSPLTWSACACWPARRWTATKPQEALAGALAAAMTATAACSERSCSEDETPGLGGSLASSSGSCPNTQVTTSVLAGQQHLQSPSTQVASPTTC